MKKFRWDFAVFILYIIIVILLNLFVIKQSSGPVHFNDEVRYWDIAFNISNGAFNIQEEHHYPPLYPLFITPAFTFFQPNQTYSVVKWINVLSIASVCFPIYLILKKFMDGMSSILVTSIVMISPIFITFPGSVLSENLFLPLFFWALYLSLFDIFPKEDKWIFFQELLFGSVLAFLFLTRYIALALIPAFYFIWWLKTHNHSANLLVVNKEIIFRLILSIIPLMLFLGVWVNLGLKANLPFVSVFGFGLTPNNEIQDLNLSGLLLWILLYLSYLLLVSSPAVLLFIFSIFNINLRNWRNDYERWILSLVIVLIFFLIPTVEHSWSAWYNNPLPTKIQGRYIIYFAPLFFISAFITLPNLKSKSLFGKKLYLVSIIIGIWVIFSYLVFFKGEIFLGKRISFSPSSPFGFLVSQLGLIFLASVVFMYFFLTYALIQKKLKITPYLSIFYIVLFIIGGLKVFQRRLVELQHYNYQAKNISEVFYKEIQENQIAQPWVIDSVFNKHFDEKSKYYLNTLKFNGFFLGNTSFTPDDSDEILSIDFSGKKYYLFTEDYFDPTQKILQQFELQDDTYIISMKTE